MKRHVLLPDPGEGLTEAEVVTWRVAVGDRVEVNDPVVEVETAKSIVELPSPFAGEVIALAAEVGDVVQVGTVLLALEDGEAEAEASGPTLVGYGASDQPRGRRRRGRVVASAPKPPAGTADQKPDQGRRAQAVPLVRKVARDLGVAIDEVTGTGPAGRVTKRDVEAAAGASSGGQRVPVRGVRRATADNVARSVSTHVHVTEWLAVDVSASMRLLETLRARREFRDLRVTPLLLVAKACCLAMARTPELNSSWRTEEIVIHDDLNLGIAAATPRGLMVPNVKAAQRLNLPELCRQLNDLVATARDGALQPSHMAGGTFTITNVGVFGVDGGTPVINGEESAILCMGAIQRRPWVVGSGADERIEPRDVMELSLSFDHRVIDGEQGSRFLRDVADLLSQPALGLAF